MITTLRKTVRFRQRFFPPFRRIEREEVRTAIKEVLIAMGQTWVDLGCTCPGCAPITELIRVKILPKGTIQELETLLIGLGIGHKDKYLFSISPSSL